MKKNRLRCIIAGFDPFGKASFNPSGELALLFPDLITAKVAGELPVQKLLLPTCCEESWKVLKKAFKKFKKDDLVVIVCGLAEGRKQLSLERVALNLRDYRIEDNNGHQEPPAKIRKKSENALFTKAPVDKIKNALIKKGIPCEVSNYAGAFVCNDIYFNALDYQNAHENLRVLLFVHVPLPKDFWKSIQANKKQTPKLAGYKKGAKINDQQQLLLLQESVQLALLECVKYIDDRSHLM